MIKPSLESKLFLIPLSFQADLNTAANDALPAADVTNVNTDDANADANATSGVDKDADGKKGLGDQIRDKVPDKYEDNKVVAGTISAADKVDGVRDKVPVRSEHTLLFARIN